MASSEAGWTGRRVVVLGVGGTIAGTAASPEDNVGYTAAQVGVEQLAQAVPGLQRAIAKGLRLDCEQVAQLDSKDMSHAVWRALAERTAAWLARPDVDGVVITHGTDTLEETAYLLQRALAPHKPVVLTAAMRPASSAQADGPQNLLDAVSLALQPGARGVVAVLGGAVWAGAEVRKVHPYRLDAFNAGDAGAIGYIEEGRLRRLRDWPDGAALGLSVLAAEVWPEVQVVLSHAGADGRIVDLLLDAGVQGLVVACTGNGTLHQDLASALHRATQRGVAVLRALRGGAGVIIGGGHEDFAAAAGLTPGQARVELLLQLLARSR
ncbi:MAG: asparaginase [Leptothrix sp. (in: b-proteobacteria)]